MAGYGQGAKRQKLRERDVDYFQSVDKLEYSRSASASEVACYRQYCATERVLTKSIEEWTKLSLSYTHFRHHVPGTYPPRPRPWDDGTNTVDNNKRCIKAFFEFITKLGIKYWTAFDSDLVPWIDGWEESREQWDDMVEYLNELMQKYHVKMLWLAPDLHSHYRYSQGAFTSNDVTTYTQAATQIKKCLELSQRLNAENLQISPHQDGYRSLFQTDVSKEIKLFAKLLKMAAEYKEKLNYRCQLCIMPYRVGLKDLDVVNKYMWDVTSCLYLLKHYNLEKYYKVCSPPGHHMVMANVYNMLGGVVISGEMDPCDDVTLTHVMKTILEQGSAPPCGISLLLCCGDCEPREACCAAVRRVDAVARALRRAAGLHAQQTCHKHIQQRYGTFYSGFGSRIISSDVSLDECDEYYKKNYNSQEPACKYHQMELTFQRYLDSNEHV